MDADQWQKLTLMQQLGNIGSALELWDLTITDPRWRQRLAELTRSREIFCAAVLNSSEYKTTLADLQKYFLYFGIATRADK